MRYYIKYAKIVFDKLKGQVNGLRPHRKKDFKSCGECVFINNNTILTNKENISFASNVYIGPECRIFGFGGVAFGAGVVLGERVTIISSNHNYDTPDIDMLPFDKTNVKKSVSLGDFSWVGSNSIILPGVCVGKYAVIAAGSVVTKSTEDYSIYAGNPARMVGYRKNQDLEGITKAWASTKSGSIYIVE